MKSLQTEAPFQIKNKDSSSLARRAEFSTPHGTIQTPSFMQVGTFGAVRYLSSLDLEECGTQVMLANAYHFYLRPGIERTQRLGGLHSLNKWNRPILTDSGGFQVFSLSQQRQISEKSVMFRNYIDGKWYDYSPKVALDIQSAIGSDIRMVLDVCPHAYCSLEEARAAVKTSLRWAEQAKNLKAKDGSHLFGIVQGALFPELRFECLEALEKMDFDGYALGGLAVGESIEEREKMVAQVSEKLPIHKPRYLMGVGTPVDILFAVRCGIDLFDCIIPQKHARHGLVYTSKGFRRIRRAFFAEKKDEPLDENCDCKICRNYSLAYLHQLLRSEDPTSHMMLSYHNTFYYERLMQDIRTAICEDRYEEFYQKQRVILDHQE